MPPPAKPYQPYAAVTAEPNGPGDARPTSMQVLKDEGMIGALRNKTILITGCSGGLGVETARALYETGAQLFLTARDTSKLDSVIDDIIARSAAQDVPRPQTLALRLDSFASIRKAAEEFKQRSSSLHVLINNAGVMATPYSKTEDGFELQIGTNHLGHFLLFQLLKPLLLSSATADSVSRVVNVTSAGHRLGRVRLEDLNFEQGGYEKWAAYAQSKTANIWMASSIERHYGAQHLRGLSVHPGAIDTGINRHLAPEDLSSMGVDMSILAKLSKSPEQGAATTVWAATSAHFEQRGGFYLVSVGEAAADLDESHIVSEGYAKHTYDVDGEEKLWRLSCALVGEE